VLYKTGCEDSTSKAGNVCKISILIVIADPGIFIRIIDLIYVQLTVIREDKGIKYSTLILI